MIDADRSDLLTLVTDATAGRDLLDAGDNYELAGVLHGLLHMYGAALRATCTELGQVAIGVALEDVSDHDPDPDQRAAAELILAHNAALIDGGEGAFLAFGVENFNDALDRIDRRGRICEVVLAVANVWRRLMPAWHTPDGLEILRRAEW
jgi:hypothetical protein